jgi:hypothetical protein
VSLPEHQVRSLIDTDESPLGRSFTDFQHAGRQIGVVDEGPIDVTLFFRDRMPHDPVNASTWASEMLRTFRGVLADELLLACAVCVTSLMRWSIFPTAENYARMPAIARPTRLQRAKPHPAWIDLMIFPAFRDALIEKQRDWVGPCTRAEWKVCWSGSVAVVQMADRMVLSDAFIAYVVNPQNWTMRRCILEDFPEIADSEMRILSD